MDVEEFEPAALRERLETLKTTGAAAESGTLRERFRRTMFFQDVDVRPNFEFGYWKSTLQAWHQQGLPVEVDNEAKAYAFFGIENWAMVPAGVGLKGVVEPGVVSEDEDTVTTRDHYGVISVQNKHRDETIPHYIDFPVKDRATWEPFKAALNPDDEDRYAQLPAALDRLKGVDAPIGVSGGSLIGVPRNILGFERIAVLPYEDPDLFREIVDTFGHCITTALARTLPHIQVDFCMGWEDFCFNQGPVIPPAVFEEVAGPWIRRIADLLVNHGCCVYTTDTDGNIMPVIDTFLNNGLNTMFPVEVKGGSDPVAIREKYGKRVKLWGGVDKMALMKDKAAIDAELTRLLPYVEQGGFVPGVDHRVPSDVPLDNYKYYLDRKRELFRVGGEPKY